MILRRFAVTVLAATLLAVAGANFAGAAPEIKLYGPIASISPDSGTCGNEWANDAFNRHFSVNTLRNADGTYSVVEDFKKGMFVTSAGASPGACDTNPGGTVAAGVTGTFQGSLSIIVHGKFNPAATCASGCDTTAGFVVTVFGANATYDVPSFEFDYSTAHNGLWKNASEKLGGNQGDISGAP